MNIIDFIIIFVIVIFVGLGYYRGFFKVVMNLIEYILSIFLAIKFYPKFAQFLNEKFFLNEFFEESIFNSIKNAIEKNAQAEGLVIPVDSIELPMVENLANMVVMVISIFILFFVFRLLIKIISFFVDKLTKLPILKEFNKIGGLVAGLIEGVLVIFLCLAIINSFNNEQINKKMEESLLGDKFGSAVTNVTVSLINRL